MKRVKDFFIQIFRAYAGEFRIIFHDAGVLLFFAFLPLVYPIIYSLIYNPELVRDVKVVVVDNDRSALSRELVRRFDATQEARVIGYAADLPEARKAMNSHKCYGILEIPDGFSRNVGRSERADAVLYCEMSLLLRYRSLLMASTNISQELGAEIRAEKLQAAIPDVVSYTGEDLLPVTSVAMGNITSGFDSFIMPAVLILIFHQCIILAVGMMGGAQHEDPRMIHYCPWNEQPSLTATFLGKTFAYYMVLIVPVTFLIYYVPLIFRFPMAGSIVNILIFLMPMSLACIFLGFLIQTFMRQRETIFLVWVVTSVFLLFLSGITWPRYAMHGIWLWISDILPATWGVNGFVHINTNGADISQVANCYKMLWILAGAYFVLALIAHKFVMRKQINLLRRHYSHRP